MTIHEMHPMLLCYTCNLPIFPICCVPSNFPSFIGRVLFYQPIYCYIIITEIRYIQHVQLGDWAHTNVTTYMYLYNKS